MSALSMYASECARATSASESRYRITVPITPARAARVIALDANAAAVTRRVAGGPWANARFYTCEVTRGVAGSDEPADEVLLYGLDGSPAALGDVLKSTDVVVVIATDNSGQAS